MNKIVRKEHVGGTAVLLEVEAPAIASSFKAGTFAIVRIDNQGERIPLAIVDANQEHGTISLVVSSVGVTTTKLCQLNEGDTIANLLGPLGNAVKIENYGAVLCVGIDFGVADLLPIAKALHQAGNTVVMAMVQRDDTPWLSDTLAQYCTQVIRLHAIDEVSTLLNEQTFDRCYVAGAVAGLRSCCEATRDRQITTRVLLNNLMVDGTGMCGACRIQVGDHTRFVCVDGPEFDGHQVNWDELSGRITTYVDAERSAIQSFMDKVPVTAEETATTTTNDEWTMDVPPTDETFEQLTDRDAEWRKELRAAMKNPERMAIKRVTMPHLDPDYRITTTKDEVAMGLTKEMVMREAHRCLDCPKPMCVEGCPVHNNIPSFIKNIERGQFLAAIKVLRNTTSLPAVCGRVCPHELQCEGHCIHNKMKSQPVAIGALERFVADFERETGNMTIPTRITSNGIKVAAIGGGPAGLAFAGDMAKWGYDVYVFEQLHELGGALRYGIPEFRLPHKIIDVEVQNLKRMGVHFVTDCMIGKTLTIEDMERQGFKGIFVAAGAGTPNFMDIPGENAANIMSANEYLTRVNLMHAENAHYDTPLNKARHVMVVGGGNTAMDSCRTARRLGAEVTLVYRRTEVEMPAFAGEVAEAKEEGIVFMNLHNPIEYHTDEHGAVCQAVLQVMELGEPDESGRRRPVPVAGKTVTLDVDQVIVAVGIQPNPSVPLSVPNLNLGRKNAIIVDERMQTNHKGLYAGGDIINGGATVIRAMGDGRHAARSMHEDLMAEKA